MKKQIKWISDNGEESFSTKEDCLLYEISEITEDLNANLGNFKFPMYDLKDLKNFLNLEIPEILKIYRARNEKTN